MNVRIGLLYYDFNFLAIRDLVGDEAAADDREVERQLGGPDGHHRLQLAAQTPTRS